MFAEGKNKELLKSCLDEAEAKVITRATQMTKAEMDEMFRLRSMNLDYYDDHLTSRLRELESKWGLESHIKNERYTVVQAYAQALYNERVGKIDKRTFTEDEVREILKEVLSNVGYVGVDDGCGGSISTGVVEDWEVIESFKKFGIELK